MANFIEVCVSLITVLGLLLGGCSIYWVNVRPCARRAWWGRCLFVVALVMLGGGVLLAALTRAEGLAPLGLLSGLLIVSMLWESPGGISDDPTPPACPK
jgi:hypothetical protein